MAMSPAEKVPSTTLWTNDRSALVVRVHRGHGDVVRDDADERDGRQPDEGQASRVDKEEEARRAPLLGASRSTLPRMNQLFDHGLPPGRVVASATCAEPMQARSACT